MNPLPATIEHSQLTSIDDSRLDQNPAVVYLASLAAGSRPTMQDALSTIAQVVTGNETADYLSIPWAALRFQHTAAIRARLVERYQHSTANKMLSALRGVLKAAWKLGQMTAEAYHTAASVENVKGETLPAGRSIPAGELSALLSTCDQSLRGIRDAAIIAMLYAAGLRRAELVALDLSDVDLSVQALRVQGKRNKQRLVPIAGGAVGAVGDWLAVRSDTPGPLFWGISNRNRGGRLTTQAIYNMIEERARTAGIARLTPHDFRRTFVGDLLDAGADIVTVQRMAGHADVSTTARYDRRGEVAKQKAAALLHVPYRRRTLASKG